MISGGGMDFQDHLAETLFDLAHAVYARPSLDELCQFLAMRICPSGEVARVYVGRLDSDGVIRTETSFGYSTETKVSELETPLETLRPMPFSLQKGEVYIANHEEVVRDFPDYVPLDQRSPWNATAVVPTLGRHVFVFRLQIFTEKKESLLLYFRAAGAILSFCDFQVSSPDTKLMAKTKLPETLLGQFLTHRQQTILKLILDRKTNVQIANFLGYSESLIKQETMIVYAKLGVNGRQELLHSQSLRDDYEGNVASLTQ